MNLKNNVNKIHSDLLNKFESVNIFEKSNKKWGNYIELSVIENNKNIRVVISKSDLDSSVFNWSYYSNPTNESSNLVERTSSLNSFLIDVNDILEKNRFDSEYIESIK